MKRLSGEEALALVRADREHGASWLARRALAGLAHATQIDAGEGEDGSEGADTGRRLADAQALSQALALARPSMAAIGAGLASAWWAAERADGDAAARLRALHTEAERRIAGWESASVGMLRHARPLVGGVVYTLSRSGSVEAVLRALVAERAAGTGEPLRVVVSESRPGGEGVALATALAQAGARVTLAPDAASGALMAEADVALVGADSVSADGSVVNKVGTYPLALVAHAQGKPVYALCERVKITAPSYPLALEEAAPEQLTELTELSGARVAGVTLRAPLFDLTPGDLLTAVITEEGVVGRAEIARLAEEAEHAWQALMAPLDGGGRPAR